MNTQLTNIKKNTMGKGRRNVRPRINARGRDGVVFVGEKPSGKRNPQQGWIRVRVRVTAPSLQDSSPSPSFQRMLFSLRYCTVILF